MEQLARIFLVLGVMVLAFIVTDTILNYYYPAPPGALVPNLSVYMLLGLITGYLVVSLVLVVRKRNRNAKRSIDF